MSFVVWLSAGHPHTALLSLGHGHTGVRPETRKWALGRNCPFKGHFHSAVAFCGTHSSTPGTGLSGEVGAALNWEDVRNYCLLPVSPHHRPAPTPTPPRRDLAFINCKTPS